MSQLFIVCCLKCICLKSYSIVIRQAVSIFTFVVLLHHVVLKTYNRTKLPYKRNFRKRADDIKFIL